ncbi:MAG: sigma-54 dependent transcriptional regulator [Verrucomicrobiia bacterium]
MAQTTVLVVDDERNMLATMESILKSDGYVPLLAHSGKAALEQLATHPVQVIVSDARMPEMDGFKLLAEVRQRYPQIPFIMVTGYATPKLAVQAIKNGAVDYLSKPFDPEELLHVIDNAVCRELLQEENYRLKRLLVTGPRYQVDDLLGRSPRLAEIRELIRVAAPTDATVLLLGESGTGKEMAASALHVHSRRAGKPFISINCAAIPENLLESELFGHEKGAFTGAVKQRIGRFEEASGGTLFLDEIGEMSGALQAKLLRVLEEKRFERVGGNERVSVDVRVIAATNTDVVAALAAGRLRQDLYHRLNVVQIAFPPLRERREDITLLAAYFLQQFNEAMGKHLAGFTEAADALMQTYDWPGNVRELRNAIERAAIVETTGQIRPQSLPSALAEQLPAGTEEAPPGRNLEESLVNFERQQIERALQRYRGRINDTAAALGISRHALRYRMQKLGMDVDKLFGAEQS